MSDVSMIINGERRAAPSSFGVINPATGEVDGEAPDCSRQQLDEAFDAAAKAQVDWQIDEDARRQVLRQAADAMFGAAERIGPMLTAEQGRPLAQAKEEVILTGVWFQYYAELERPREIIQDDETAFAEVVRRPMGVVAAITPWNYPLVLAAWKIAPALRAGNTVVLKPSPYTPRSSLLMGEVLAQVLPPGVLNVVSGGDGLGEWMTSHPVPRKISFTGSVSTGKRVAAAAAPDLKRVTLELGGNDAAIVLDDADPGVIADDIFTAAFANSGQICSAIKRVYVPESLHDPLVDELAARAHAVKVGDGMDPESQLGPINNAPQFERVSDLVRESLSNGATAAAGGAPLERPGYFFTPTILTGVSDGERIVDEEQFGPALPIITYRDTGDAVARANATSFGLGGSVWSSDPDRASSIASQLECGTTWVNAHLALAPHQPFGGFKWSGVGVENGPWGLASFTEVQARYVTRSQRQPTEGDEE